MMIQRCKSISTPGGLLMTLSIALLFALNLIPTSDANTGPSKDESDVLKLLKTVCEESSRDGKKDLSIDEVLKLIAAYKDGNHHLCHNKFAPAILELEHLISEEIKSDVCGLETYRYIRRFHRRFISYYTPETSESKLKELKVRQDHGLEPIPEALRRFFVIYALQISAICKRSLWKRFQEEVAGQFGPEDLNIMRLTKNLEAELTGEDYREKAKQLEDLQIGSQAEPDELPKSENFKYEMDESDELASELADGKLYIQVPFESSLKKAKDLCELKFKPIYEELFFPVVRLANLGYSDQINSKPENEQLKYNKELRDWYRIIEFCEIIKDIEVIQDNSSESAIVDLLLARKEQSGSSRGNGNGKAKAEQSRGSSQNKITLLTKAQAIELKAKIEANIERHGGVSSFDTQRTQVDHQKLKFGSRLWLSEESDRKGEISDFEKRLKTLISHKTDLLHQLRQKLRLKVKGWLNKHKLEFKSKDGNTAVGKVALFLEKHQTAIRMAGLIVGVILVASINLG